MELNTFINSIGYDGNSAVADKMAFSKNKGKSLSQLVEDEEGLQQVADMYNKLAGSSYKKEQMYRLFGVSKVDVKKVLFL